VSRHGGKPPYRVVVSTDLAWIAGQGVPGEIVDDLEQLLRRLAYDPYDVATVVREPGGPHRVRIAAYSRGFVLYRVEPGPGVVAVYDVVFRQ
jgi:hypothetical protein